MKKIYAMIFAICMTASMVHAQNAYIRLGVGGGVGLKQYSGDIWADETYTSTSHDFVIKSNAMGGGFNVNLAAGYMLSKYVGIELGVNEFIGLSKKTTYTSTNSSSDYTSEGKISGMMLQIVPALVITPGLEKLNPYARLGMIVGIMPSISQKYTSSSSTNGEVLKATHSSESTAKISGGVAFGF
ncbi:MAG: outer membrane beta-barrel protein, partial [Bacteroidetes bacterium]|nr:outer membrane beta-barrel protein [Bacteroidota bacterium]